MESTSPQKAFPRPKDYRTPSPPPWSPILDPIDAESVDWNHATRPPKEARYGNNTSGTYDGLWPSTKFDHRSHGSMDAFASIALATQHADSLSKNGKRAHDIDHGNSRAKRARTELSPPGGPSQSSLRPVTSYVQSFDTSLEDAELLVHFSQQLSDKRGFGSGNIHESPSDERIPSPKSPSPRSMSTLGEQVPEADHMAQSIPTTKPVQETIIQDGLDAGFDDRHGAADTAQILNATSSSTKLATLPPPNLSESSTSQEKSPDIHEQRAFSADPDATTFKKTARGSCESQLSSETSQKPPDPSTSTDIPYPGSKEGTFNEAGQTNTIVDMEYSAPIENTSLDQSVDRVETIDEDMSGTNGEPLNDQMAARTGSNDLGKGHNGLEEVQLRAHACTRETPGTLNSPSTSHAVCAACKFSKNSLSIDSENSATSWISCDGCKSWFHFACAGFKNEREVRSVDKYRCKRCKHIYGATSYVRKSTRAHTAIDYAGLHQGVIKTSDDRPEHHYIQPIKNGTISFRPETFPRMRPELVNAEFFEKGNGMREPIVIPASLNPRPSAASDESPMAAHSQLSLKSIGIEDSASLEGWLAHDTEPHRVSDDGQDALDMVMPRDLTVRKVAELYGPEEKIEVIDVKSQNGEGKKWNMKRWVDYYESPDENKVVRNVISLEVSQSRLGRLIRRPQIVRELDLQDAVWPEDLLNKGEYPHVQFYCLMSVADCFTDFHIDFGGSSVFYHILKGKKTFLFIPPKEKHLKRYEEWCMSPAQNWTFLPDQTHECYRVDLSEGDTMLIPSGWIHAVWTPEDSLVIGGNFLTRLNFGMQLRIAQVEKTTGVARKFRYPHFQKLHWFTVFSYLRDDPLPAKVREHLESGFSFERENPSSNQFDEWGENSEPGPENFHARYYPEAELDGLPDLLRYVLRTVLIENGTITEGISTETRNAVRKSIPRGHGEPMEILKKFAIWCAWKRGNEPIPYWAYPDAVIETPASDKHSVAASKKLAEEAALKAPRRQSQRMQSQKEARNLGFTDNHEDPGVKGQTANDAGFGGGKTSSEHFNEQANSDDLSPSSKQPKHSYGSIGSHRKTACESCRRRRRACKHKDSSEPIDANSEQDAAPSNLVHKEALLNGNALQEKLSSLGGLFNSLTAKSDGSQGFTTTPISLQKMSISNYANEQAVGETPTTPMMTASTTHIASHPNAVVDLTTASEHASPSRPRTKACNHCRKSKRRCIHDAFGNEDPAKVAESAVPRPHARKTNKADATPLEALTRPLGEPYDQSASSFAAPMGIAPTANMVSTTSELHISDQVSEDPRPVLAFEQVERKETIAFDSGMNFSGMEDDPRKIPQPNEPFAIDPAFTNDVGELGGTLSGLKGHEEGIGLNQASSSLVSPPASSHETNEDSPSHAVETPSKSSPASSDTSHPPGEQYQRYTPESGSIRRASQSSSRKASVEKEAPKVKKRRSTSVQDADEESLRLIKELQAQDLGLRRRLKS